MTLSVSIWAFVGIHGNHAGSWLVCRLIVGVLEFQDKPDIGPSRSIALIDPAFQVSTSTLDCLVENKEKTSKPSTRVSSFWEDEELGYKGLLQMSSGAITLVR